MADKRPALSNIRVRPGKGAPPSVDGHPGWVEQSTRQYIGLCGILIAAQAFLVGISALLSGAASAAWWCVAVGGMLGILVWIPTWGIMRGDTPVSLDEAFFEAYGRILGSIFCIVFCLMNVTSALLTIRVLGSIIRQYFLLTSNETLTSLTVLCVLTLVLYRHGTKGLSRFFWFIRKGFFLVLIASCAMMYSGINLDNLFPMLGVTLPQTLAQLPAAAGGAAGVVLLSLLPKQTGSAKPVRFTAGLKALLLGTLTATGLVLMINLTMPPQAIPDMAVWGRKMVFAAEYMPSRLFRLTYLLLLILMMLIAGGYSLACSATLLQGAFRSQNNKWSVLAVCSVPFVLLSFYDNSMLQAVEVLQDTRLLILCVPLWLTWIVLLIRRGYRRRKEGLT